MQHDESEMNIEKRTPTKLKFEGESTETVDRNDLWITKNEGNEKKIMYKHNKREKK